MYQIIVDFDGTITLNDSTTEIIKAFLPEINKKYQKGLRNQTVTIKQYIQEQVEMLRLTPKEYQQVLLEKVIIDPTFVAFYNKFPTLMVVSSGAQQHVQWVLENNGINIATDQIISNQLEFHQKRISVKIYNQESENAVDKARIVNEKKKLGKKVIFIGDSYSDFAAAKEADVVFARKGQRLHRYCILNDIACYGYENFEEIMTQIQQILDYK